MDRKGQAAITDALFFMMIVAGLATTLFVFTSSFGKDVSTFVEQSYNSTYATTALKTILYTNASRTGESLSQTKEADFLMTLIKEDYANPPAGDAENFEVSAVSSKELIQNIDQIMKPINSANDYLIYIQAEGDTSQGGVLNFPLIYTKLLYSDNGVVGETAFFCTPPTGAEFRNKLDAFVVKAQATGRSIVPIELRQIFFNNESGNYEMQIKEGKLRSEMGLIIWRTKLIPEFVPSQWNCTPV